MKKFIIAALALTLLSATAIPALAADTDPVDSTMDIGEVVVEPRESKDYSIYLSENNDTQLIKEMQLVKGSSVKILGSTLSPSTAKFEIWLEYYNGSNWQTIASHYNYKSGGTASLYTPYSGEFRLYITGWNSSKAMTGIMKIDM